MLAGVYPSASAAAAAASGSSFAPASPRSYRLVTAPSPKREEVEAVLEKVRAEVPRAEIIKVPGEKLYYRLVAGHFNDAASALRLRSDLAKRNITSYILQSKNRYRVIVSAHVSKEYAREEQRQLASKNITCSIVTYNQPLLNWRISSVDTFELRDAVYAASIMTSKDVVTTIE